MAHRLGRSASTLSRELRRNGGGDTYAAEAAQSARQRRRVLSRPLPKLHAERVLWDVVTELLHWRWSPQQIAATLRRTFPQDPSRQVSHETIYTAIYAQPRVDRRARACVRHTLDRHIGGVECDGPPALDTLQAGRSSCARGALVCALRRFNAEGRYLQAANHGV